MAVKVTVTKAERAALEFFLPAEKDIRTAIAKDSAKHFKAYKGFLEKVDNRAAAPAPAGLGYPAFARILKEVLGKRLAVPPGPTAAWYAQQNQRIRATGINDEQARLVALAASKMRFPQIAIELVISRITALLAQGQTMKEPDDDVPAGFGRVYDLDD